MSGSMMVPVPASDMNKLARSTVDQLGKQTDGVLVVAYKRAGNGQPEDLGAACSAEISLDMLIGLTVQMLGALRQKKIAEAAQAEAAASDPKGGN